MNFKIDTSDVRNPDALFQIYNDSTMSRSVFERGRLNEFGEVYCHLAHVTREYADAFIRQATKKTDCPS